MKITLQNINEVSEETQIYEKFKSKKRKLSSVKSVSRLIPGEGVNKSFTLSDLEELKDKAIVDEIICIIKSGKEATVYLGKSEGELLAVKVYTDLKVRSFRNDSMYRQGRFIGEARVEKAINQGSEFGLNAHQILWVHEEFRQMKFLYEAGIPLPRPIANSGLVIIMEFIGDGDEAAPRISDLDLDKYEAEDAFIQSVKILESIVSSGRVHGDFSAYNLLLLNNKVFVIDFPQVIEVSRNPSAKEILRRDVESLCKSFKKYKIETDADRIFKKLLKLIYDSGSML